MSERKQVQVKKLCPLKEICDILKKNRDKKLIQCEFSAFPQFGLFWNFGPQSQGVTFIDLGVLLYKLD